MTVVPVEDQSVIFGQDFLRLVRAILVPHEDCFLFEDGTETFGVSLTMRKKFGWVTCVYSMTLFKVIDGDKPQTITHPQEETIM